MSLLSYIIPENCSRDELEAALNDIKLPDQLFMGLSPRKTWFGLAKNKQVYLEIWLHDFLTDSSSSQDETWDMQQAGLERLAEFLINLSRVLKRNFTFSAIWAGDPVEQTIVVSVSEIVDLVRNNKIGTQTEYFVKI